MCLLLGNLHHGAIVVVRPVHGLGVHRDARGNTQAIGPRFDDAAVLLLAHDAPIALLVLAVIDPVDGVVVDSERDGIALVRREYLLDPSVLRDAPYIVAALCPPVDAVAVDGDAVWPV